MFKKFFPMILIFGMVCMGYGTNAIAVDSLFQPPPSSSSSEVLSPEDFAKQVSQTAHEQQAADLQQLNQQLSQIPKPGSSNPPAAATPGATPETPPTSPEQTLQQTPAKEETEEPAASNYAPTQTRLPPPPPPRQVMQPQPTAQPQVYTGFTGGGQTTAPSSQPAKGTNSGGWNIKY
ncbi:MAG: hypothetical protein ACYCQI_01840 [Gammaproteobacteria bacterium]